MPTKDRERILEHVHGVFAGSLLVVAAFVLTTVPVAFLWLVQGRVGASALVYPVLFLAFLWATVREARMWHQYVAAGEAAGA